MSKVAEPVWSGTVGSHGSASEVPRGYWLYVVKADDAVLYVGQTVEVYRRLRQHFVPANCIAWLAGPLTDLARDYWDEAQAWTIDVYQATVDLYRDEAVLIRKLRPCLNSTHNVRGRALSKHLKTVQAERDRERIDKIRYRREVL